MKIGSIIHILNHIIKKLSAANTRVRAAGLSKITHRNGSHYLAGRRRIGTCDLYATPMPGAHEKKQEDRPLFPNNNCNIIEEV